MTERYRVLDFLRGFALFNMIIYHALWDVVYIFDKEIAWFDSAACEVWQFLGCSIFVLLSGFCVALGKKKIKRAIMVLCASVLVSIVTLVATPENTILFGVLSMLGSGMLLMSLLDGVLRKVNPCMGILVCMILFLIFYDAQHGVLGFGGWEIVGLPDWLYANLFTTYLGFPQPGFESADYFGLVPWLFLYASGYFLHSIFHQLDWLKYLVRSLCAPLEWMGRHSLIIYMLHQPVIWFVMSRIF